jgi:hypothetical protein
MARQFWSIQDLERLKTHYPDNVTADLRELFPGRSISSINSAAFIYGLKKSEIFHAKGLGGRIAKGTRIGIGSEFKKGMAPHNKGKEISEWMCAENIENSKKGRFKKGNVSHNTLPIGSERISKDGYIEVKIRHSDNLQHNNNYEFKHRVLWQDHHGPIPEGMVIRVNGDKLNFTIDELEMISQREHAIRNNQCDTAIVKKYFGVKEPEAVEKIIEAMPDVIQLKRTNLILNSKIKNYENNN